MQHNACFLCLSLLALGLVAPACGDDPPTHDASNSDGDADTDADSDADASVDSSADSDAPTDSNVDSDAPTDSDADSHTQADSDADTQTDGDTPVDGDPPDGDVDEPRSCPQGFQNGQGRVYLFDEPDTLATAELLCLSGEGALEGYYVSGIHSSLEDEPSYEAAFSPDLRFFYEPGDTRFDEVQAYYVISEMARWITDHLNPADGYSSRVALLRQEAAWLAYDRGEVASRQWCGLMTMGMQRITGPAVNVDVLAHELGHHIVYAMNPRLENSMLHEGLADYLAAAFTADPVIEPSESPVFDRPVNSDHRAPEDIITRGAYCQIMAGILADNDLESVYPTLLAAVEGCLNASPEVYNAPAHHYAGMILSAALWEAGELMGHSPLLTVLLAALDGDERLDTGDLLFRLIEEDTRIHGGAHGAVLEAAFSLRGIDENLELGFVDMGFTSCGG